MEIKNTTSTHDDDVEDDAPPLLFETAHKEEDAYSDTVYWAKAASMRVLFTDSAHCCLC